MKMHRRKLVTCFVFLSCVFLTERAIAQNAEQQTSFFGVSLTLKECVYAGGLVNCYLTVTSIGQDRYIDKPTSFDGNNHWNIWDESGTIFNVKNVRYGNKEWAASLVADLPTPMAITADFSGASTIKLLEMAIAVGTEWKMVRFRDVSVQNLSPSSLSDKVKVEYNGITIAFNSCGVKNGTLTCNFTAVSSGKDSRTDEGYCIGCRSPRIVDNLANEYSVDNVIYGNKENTRELVADIPTPVRVISTGFSSEATGVALLEIRFQDTIIHFRNLPIGAVKESSGYSVSKDNIAYKKSVVIDTNGAAEVETCGNPSKITDGSLLSNNCSTDGVVGFQNNDYNESMEVTVKIDLQQAYNITKIRYNQGNVQRAETWNADSMVSPFGKIGTLSGSPNKGVWTEQTGSITTSILEIKFKKTRTKYANDWLYIGEIEVIGTLVTKPDLSEYKTPDSTLAKLIQDEMRERGNVAVEVEVFRSNTEWLKIDVKVGSLGVDQTNILIREIVNRRKLKADVFLYRRVKINGEVFWVKVN